MKTPIYSIVFLLILFQSCKEKSNVDPTADLIKKVENGLITNPVHIEGDPTSTIEARLEHYGIPGVSIAVIHKGEIAWAKGYGLMDRESNTPVTEQTLFQVSTIGMPLTAYAALRLVEQHKVALNEDINTYLTSWKVPENEFTKEKKVTLKHLLNHSAGINMHAFEGYPKDQAVPTLLEVLHGVPPANSNPIMVDKIPGENFWISAGGYTIVQQMMMDVEGKAFPQLMDELVLKPLGMHHSTFNQTLTAAQSERAATGYLRDGSAVKGKRHIYPELAPNGLWTTAKDLAKFIINIQQVQKGNDNSGLSKSFKEMMLQPFVEDRYGLGFLIYDHKDDIYFEHHGWSTGFYSRMTAHKDNDYGVVVLANTPNPAFIFEVFRAVSKVYAWDNYAPTYKKMEIKPSLRNGISGTYRAENRVVEVFQKDDQLFAKNILYADAEELIRVSDSTFARRNSSQLMQFKPNTVGNTIDLLYRNTNNESIVSRLTKTTNSQKEPVQFLIENQFEEALKAYRAFIEEHPDHPTITEDYLNDLGHHFLREERIKIAQNTLKLNTILYPDSFQVYDSYAEACVKVGEIDLAISNYSKSIALNPQNNRAREKRKELQKRTSNED
ncbi:serine hydrolase [Spongiimicrobium salis]|uniref:serine hydrolase n=1 Tax=Spongiimicrobium salis TaxID=1667022 RepID=UPI00374D3B4B